MKPVFKPITVWTLTTCLTTLQFSPLALAQETTNLKTEPALVKSVPKKTELGTPSLIMAPQKGFEIGLGYSRIQSEMQVKNLIGKADFASDRGSTAFAMAINPNIFAGVDIGYVSSKTRSDFAVIGTGAITEDTSEGVGEPTVSVGGRMNANRFSMLAGLDYQIATGNSETQLKNAQTTTNNGKNGGSEIMPKFAVFTNIKSSMMFGATGSYRIRQDRKITVKDMSGFTSDRTEKGGNSANLTLFAETPTDMSSVGGMVTYSKSEPTKRESIGTKEEAGSETVLAAAYGNIRAMKNLSVMPILGYQHYMNNKIGDTDLTSQNTYVGALSVRLTF